MKAVDVLGVKVKPDKVDDLVSEQLSSGTPWSERDDYDNASGLQRAMKAVSDAALQDLFLDAVVKLLTDSANDVRREAVKTVRCFGSRVNADDLARLLREHPDLYRGPIDLPEGDLRWLMISAIAAAVKPGNTLAIDMLRQAARDPAMGGSVLAGLIDADLTWMVTHPSDWLDSDGERLRVILFNVRDDPTVEKVVRAIASSPSEVRAGAIRAIREQVADRDQAGRLIRLLGQNAVS